VKQLATTIPATTFKDPVTATTVANALANGIARSLTTAWARMSEHRDARAAAELYKHLARLSDSELDQRGLDREQLERLRQSI
jgi:hypothetical protein